MVISTDYRKRFYYHHGVKDFVSLRQNSASPNFFYTDSVIGNSEPRKDFKLRNNKSYDENTIRIVVEERN